MPKMPPRDNRRNRNSRTIQGAAEGVASLLQRMSRKSGVILSTAEGSKAAASHISSASNGVAAANPAVASNLDCVRAALPAELRAHVLDCLMRPGELVLFTEAAAWATHLRLAACEAAASGAFSSLPPGTSAPPRITVRVAAAKRSR